VVEDQTTRAGVTHSAWLMVTVVVTRTRIVLMIKIPQKSLHKTLPQYEHQYSACLVAALVGVVVGLITTVGVMTSVHSTTTLIVAVTWILCVGFNLYTCHHVILPSVGAAEAVLEDVVEDPMMIVGAMICARRLVIVAVIKRRNVQQNQYRMLRSTCPLQRHTCPVQNKTACQVQINSTSPVQNCMYPVQKKHRLAVFPAVERIALGQNMIVAAFSPSYTRVRHTTHV